MAKKKKAAKAARPTKAKSGPGKAQRMETTAIRLYPVDLRPDPYEITNGDTLAFNLLAFDIVDATLIDWNLTADDPSSVSLSLGSSLSYNPVSSTSSDAIDVHSSWTAGVVVTGAGLRSGTLTVTVVPPGRIIGQQKKYKVTLNP